MSEIRVTGLRETVRSLEKFGVEVAELKEVMTKVGSLISDAAQELAPVKSGALRGSIRPGKAKAKATVRAGSARVPYAGVQNYGGYHNIEGKHFMERALDANAQEAVNEFETGISGLIREHGLT